MRLSENFTLEELTSSATAHRLGISNLPSESEILNLSRLCSDILQPIRNKWGKPIIITSGYRSPGLNKAVGGVSSSQHIFGEAADIVTSNNRLLWKLIIEMIKNGEITVGQLINEKNLSWIHISLPGHHLNQIL